MQNKVVLDGSGSVVINGTVTGQVLNEVPDSTLFTVTDGVGSLIITNKAEGSLAIVEDGEYGAVTIVHTGDMPYYSGAYTVTPTSSEQTLATANKIMAQNVTVHEIPYYETSNLSGGYTVYIGSV